MTDKLCQRMLPKFEEEVRLLVTEAHLHLKFVLGNSTEQVIRLEYSCDNFGFVINCIIETQLYISLSVQQHKYEFIHIKKLRLNITNKLG